MFKNVSNTKQQGNIGLGSAINYFTKLGLIVAIPLNDSQEYDLIIDDGVKLLKVQVKTTYNIKASGSYEVLLKTCGGNQSFYTIKYFNNLKVDILYVLCENGDVYCIPTSEILNKSTITLGKKYTKFKVY